MTPNCSDPGLRRPWHTRGARRDGMVVATASIALVFGLVGAVPGADLVLSPEIEAITALVGDGSVAASVSEVVGRLD